MDLWTANCSVTITTEKPGCVCSDGEITPGEEYLLSILFCDDI